MLGDLLDNRYRIIRTLSKGGFGQTYIAEDTRLPGHPYCVLKHLEPIALDAVQMANARRLFETEAIALGRLGEHPQIPRLLAYFEENDDFYIVQDLVRGYPLSKELKVGTKWSEANIYRLLHDVLSILVFVHDRGVIHRDIKPDNLIRRQSDRALVLVDFGSVKQIRAHAPISDETGHTIAIGTMGYMAMEQARGRPRPNSDLYSLGIIGIQAATGIKPRFFQEDFDTGELVWRNEADISDEMANFLTKMVAYHFKDRYGDAWEALRDLEQLRVAKSVNGSPVTGAVSSHWPNAFTLNHVASTVQPQSLGAESEDASLLAQADPTSLTVPDLAKALVAEHHDPEALVPQPTFMEPLEVTDISQTVAKEVHPSLPLIKQSITDTVTLDFDYIQPEAQSLGGDRPDPDGSPLPASSPSSISVQSSPQSSHSPQNSPQVLPPPPPPRRLPSNLSKRRGPKVERKGSFDGVAPSLRPSSHPSPVTPDSQQVLAEPSMVSHALQIGRDWLKLVRTVATANLNPQTGRSPSALPSTTTILVASLSTLVVAGLGMWGYQEVQQQRRITAMVQSIERQHGTHQYAQCWEDAKHLQTLSAQIYDTAIELEGRCALAQAQQLATQQDFMGAITMAQTIPEAAQSHYQESQTLIREWFVRSLEQAEAQYAEGSVNAAIATAINLANNIPSNHPLQAKIQLTTLKWSLEQSLWQKAQRLLDNRQWQLAIDQAKLLLALPPFERRAAGLITVATDNLAIESQQEASPNPVIVQPTSAESSNQVNGLSLSPNRVSPRRPQKP
ncbi:MAG: serine/threonine-protein kinase [Leptolyngbyaceae bacterium]|nr:serine/threonine-protein kinase [Leptolyngbyaceae bacterium]